MANKEVKALDVKLHNFMVKQNDVNYNSLNWRIAVEQLLIIPELRKSGNVCVSAII